MEIRKIISKIFSSVSCIVLGIIIGHWLSGVPIIQVLAYLTGGGISIAWIIDIILKYRKETKEEQLRKEKEYHEEQLRKDKLVFQDLNDWSGATRYPILTYNYYDLTKVDYRDPRVPFWDEDIKVLKKYNAYTLWEKSKKNSEKLKNEGIKAINDFHKKVDEKLNDIPLEKRAPSRESRSFLANIRLVIFTMIKDEKVLEFEFKPASVVISAINFDAIGVMGDLFALGNWLAHGLEKDLRQLENSIKDLVKDEDVIKQIQTYMDAETKLESHEPFKEFNMKLTEIVNEFKWNQKFS